MNRIEVILMVIVVGYQVIRALKKRMEGPEEAQTAGQGAQLPDVDWTDQDGYEEEPEATVPAAKPKVQPVQPPRPEVFIPLALHRPEAVRSARGATKAVKSPAKRELLRQRMIGKVILDPPPGAAMLRRFRP